MTPIPLLLADIPVFDGHPDSYLEFASHLPCGGFFAACLTDEIGAAEPSTLAAAIVAELPDLTVVVAASTVDASGAQLHDQFTTLQSLSNGRIGWEIVTAADPAEPVVDDLLDRWGDDRPLLVHAATTPAGRSFAARYADVALGAAPTKQAAKACRRELRRRATAAGRDPDDICFIPTIFTTVHDTGGEAPTPARSDGHLSVSGTGADVAAVMNAWVGDRACDGFFVKFAHNNPGAAVDFVREVAPLLSAPGLV
ncbi:LLM class flavin-dependent oxidoreductase [Gordonia sp. DT219]|uniref:LLM class flavin-dependent oxidoreductase n=1 Tax=Gordonia sp. DT219 TaxID=3416658 RepID=UPI003CF20E3C